MHWVRLPAEERACHVELVPAGILRNDGRNGGSAVLRVAEAIVPGEGAPRCGGCVPWHNNFMQLSTVTARARKRGEVNVVAQRRGDDCVVRCYLVRSVAKDGGELDESNHQVAC